MKKISFITCKLQCCRGDFGLTLIIILAVLGGLLAGVAPLVGPISDTVLQIDADQEFAIPLWESLATEAPSTGYDDEYYQAMDRAEFIDSLVEIRAYTGASDVSGLSAILAITSSGTSVVIHLQDLKEDIELAKRLMEKGQSDFSSATTDVTRKRAASVYLAGAY